MDQSNPFEGVKGIVPASEIDATGRLKIAILGLPKSGKSWFAATAPGPIMYYDFDDRAISLAGKPNIFVKTLQDKSQKNPTAMKELEKDLSNFQYRKLKGLPVPTTFVLDTATYLKKAMENECFAQDANLARKIKTGAGPTDYIMVGKSYDVINAVQGYFQYLIAEFSSLGNLIVIFHERDEKDKEKSTPEKVAYTGKVTADPQYLANSLTLFNEVFRIEATGTVGNAGTKYTVTCKTNFEVNASTTLLIDAVEPPNLMDMIAKHKANLAKQLTTK
jgi:AAA domain